MCRMVSKVKTTLNIDETVMAQLKHEAHRRNQTMSELVEAALRMLLERKEAPSDLPPLPRLSSGGSRVDVANRDALYDAMGDR